MNPRKFKFECGQVEKYWNDKMPMMVMEECGELIQALSKMERCAEQSADSEEYRNLIDEIGDMYISLKAIEIHYSKLNGEKAIETLVNERIDKKLNKKYGEKKPDILSDEDLSDEEFWDDV